MESIVAKILTKKFRIGYKKRQSVLAKIIRSFSGRMTTKEIYVLDKISLSAKNAEFIGIIGENGSGKSTLLRILAGIYQPDAGTYHINGKIVPIIDLHQGLNARLTLKENIYFCCSLLGMRKKEINQNLTPIIKFADLENYRNTKLYQVSKGMSARLALSIALFQKFDILLIDEIFSGEDEHFKKKISEKILDFKKQEKTILFVSHDLDFIKKYCDRVLWIEKGKLRGIGKPVKIVNRYKMEQYYGN